jgi:DNA-binding MarR family transcriptional regulator
MSPTELSQTVVHSTGGMTQSLDRLERADRVARAADPSDRRKVLVGLSTEGLRTAEKANASYAHERQQLLAALSPGDVPEWESSGEPGRQLGVLDVGVRHRGRLGER